MGRTYEAEGNDNTHTATVAGGGDEGHPRDGAHILLQGDSFTNLVVFVL